MRFFFLPISFTILPVCNTFQIRHAVTHPNPHDARSARPHFPTNALSTLSLPRTSARTRFYKALAASSPVVLDPDSVSSASADDEKEESNEERIGAWLPLASALGLTGLGPQQIRIMGIDLVVWHTPIDDDGAQEWVAQVDACTHRLAPLSQGRVNPDTKCIECPYHGWEFNTEGTVTNIPHIDHPRFVDTAQKEGGNVQTFPTHTVGDLIFVFLPSSLHGDMFPQSILPEQFYPVLSKIAKDQSSSFFVRDLPYSFDFMLENFMDPAHIPYAHHKLQSKREDAAPMVIKELVNNFTHVEFAFEDVTSGRSRDGYSSFQRPSVFHFGEYKSENHTDSATNKKGRVPTLIIPCVPIEAGRCRIFLPDFKIPLPLPTSLLHAGNNRFLNSDAWVHDTEWEAVRRRALLEVEPRCSKSSKPKLAGLDYIYASRSDKGAAIFRRWWLTHGFADAPRHTFCMSTIEELRETYPHRLSRKDQIDPWIHHVKHCSRCRSDLKRVKQGQALCLGVAIAFTTLIRTGATGGWKRALVGVAGAGMGFYARNFLKRFATAIEGNPERSGVADRSTAASAD